MTRRFVITDPALPPPGWVPPQTPIGFDTALPGSSAKLRVVAAIKGILEAFGPMTAEEVAATLVIYGFGPLLAEMDEQPPTKPHRSRQPQPDRWRQGRLPGMA